MSMEGFINGKNGGVFVHFSTKWDPKLRMIVETDKTYYNNDMNIPGVYKRINISLGFIYIGLWRDYYRRVV